MANYYRVAYKESQNTLKQICELFRVDSSDITIKFVMTVMGPLVFYFMWEYGNPGGGTPVGMTFFVIKYIVVWALAFVAAVYTEQNNLEKGVIDNGGRGCRRSV